MAAKKKAKKKRCAAKVRDPKTKRTRKCKKYASGRSKYCASHKGGK